MEMHQIRYFLALCEELNFTKAARRCNVAQSALTRAIRQLEKEFRGPLLYRERRNTHLSELGRMIKPHLAEIYERAQSVKHQVQEFQNSHRMKLRLGVMCTIAPTHFVDLITSLSQRHSELELEVVDSTASELEDQLTKGELEIAIYCRPDHSDTRLHYLKLFSEQMMIVIAPTHHLATRNAISFQDLQQERYLNRINCEFNEGLAWQKVGVRWRAVYWSERDDWILGMCAAGLGFGFLPEFCINHPGVVVRPVIEPEIWREVSIVTVRGRTHSPAVGALVREAVRTNWTGRKSPSAADEETANAKRGSRR